MNGWMDNRLLTRKERKWKESQIERWVGINVRTYVCMYGQMDGYIIDYWKQEKEVERKLDGWMDYQKERKKKCDEKLEGGIYITSTVTLTGDFLSVVVGTHMDVTPLISQTWNQTADYKHLL